MATTANTEAKFKPVTFWLADPRNQLRLARPGQRGDWIQFRNGRYTAATQEEYDLIKREVGYKAWEQDMEKAPDPHPISGYAPMASAALNAHIALVTVIQSE